MVTLIIDKVSALASSLKLCGSLLPWTVNPETFLCGAGFPVSLWGNRWLYLGEPLLSILLASPLHPQQLKSLKARIIKISSKSHQLCLLATVGSINILERAEDRGGFLPVVWALSATVCHLQPAEGGVPCSSALL